MDFLKKHGLTILVLAILAAVAYFVWKSLDAKDKNAKTATAVFTPPITGGINPDGIYTDADEIM